MKVKIIQVVVGSFQSVAVLGAGVVTLRNSIIFRELEESFSKQFIARISEGKVQ